MRLAIRTSDAGRLRVPHPEFVPVGRHPLVIERDKSLLDIIDPQHRVSIRPGRGRRKAQKVGE